MAKNCRKMYGRPTKSLELTKCGRKKAGVHLSPQNFLPLQDNEGALHNDNEIKANLLAKSLFPQSTTADLCDIHDFNYPPHIKISQDISEDGIL